METAQRSHFAETEFGRMQEQRFGFFYAPQAYDFGNAHAVAFFCDFIESGLSNLKMGADIFCIQIL